MRDYTPDDKARRIIVLAANGYTQTKIANMLGISKSAVSQRIKVLEKRSCLKKEKSGVINIFGLEPLGTAIVAEMARSGMYALNSNNSTSYQYEHLVRVHNIELRWDILNSIDDYLLILKRERIEYSLSGTRNHPDPIFTYKKYTIIISRISLILRCQELIGSQSDLVKLICDIFDNANAIALELEKKFGIKLKRQDKDTMYAHFSKLEVALLDNPLAKVLNTKGGKAENINTD
jgi:DNA-binding Lrp family transcriptional regulator